MQTVPCISSFERWSLQRVLNAIGRAPLRFVLNRGEGVSPAGVVPVASIIIRDFPTLLRMMKNPEIGFGDGYAEGAVEVEGDLVSALEAAYRSISTISAGDGRAGLASRWIEYLRSNTPQRSRENVHHHYDLTSDFYQLWLDPLMVYTCAYFPTPSTTLEVAQIAKMDCICRKLQLRPGETVAEAGFGWGSLALHMAKRYGVRVTAFNLSHEQTVFARQRAATEGLSRQVEFIEDDYRNMSGRFDAFVSVGMLEHVGASHYADLGSLINRSLSASGRGLLHFIGRDRSAPLSAWIRKRIFPGAYTPTLAEVAKVFEPWDLSIRDVENLRMHYTKTLEHWLARFDRSAAQVSAMFDPKFVRTWRLYLAGSLAAFRVGTMQLFQITFARSECQQLPWTRDHLYAPHASREETPKWTHVMS
jgi:cyclopropane-fatty-acyl-phospholipid synthase